MQDIRDHLGPPLQPRTCTCSPRRIISTCRQWRDPGVRVSERRGNAAEYGIVNYLNIELDPANMISFRNEFYNDENGQRTGYRDALHEHIRSA